MRNFALRWIVVFIVFGAAGAGVSSAQDSDRMTTIPSQSPNEAIERFVKECVTITPGKGRFPLEAELGTVTPKKHELALRRVRISKDFRISKFEVTQELYSAVTGKNPSRWKGLRNSVENVSWKDAVGFCNSLTKKLHEKNLIKDNMVVRLATSDEWEYCCRANSTSRYYFGDSPGDSGTTSILDKHAWHTGNAAGNDPAVGVLKPNPWGLYDMHGYLWEFVSDSSIAGGHQLQPDHRIIRGGSWRDPHSLLSSSSYLTISKSESGDHVGIRCVIAEKPEPKKAPRQ